MKLNEQISRIKKLMEQESWVRRAASGPQKCGFSPINNKSGSYGGGMSRRESRKYNKENISSLLTPNNTPDFQQRLDTLSTTTDINSLTTKLEPNQKFALVYNLTNKLNSNKEWFFNTKIKEALKLPVETNLSDKNVYDFIKSKGGFDEFLEYYRTEILL